MTPSKSKEVKVPQDPEIERVRNYSGSAKPTADIILSGATFGVSLAYGVHAFLLKGGGSSTDGTDGLMAWIQVAPLISGLFVGEFLLGATSRGESKASMFSPAVASLVPSAAPMRLVENNRIHQNHIENLMIFVPTVLSASLVDSSWAIACTVAWTASRVLFRWGYCYKENPLWRLSGMTASLLQCMICAGIGLSGVTPPSLGIFA